MSKTGDRNVLIKRRAEIIVTAPNCPVCGRPIVARGLHVGKRTTRWIRQPACSTTCLNLMKPVNPELQDLNRKALVAVNGGPLP